MPGVWGGWESNLWQCMIDGHATPWAIFLGSGFVFVWGEVNILIFKNHYEYTCIFQTLKTSNRNISKHLICALIKDNDEPKEVVLY